MMCGCLHRTFPVHLCLLKVTPPLAVEVAVEAAQMKNRGFGELCLFTLADIPRQVKPFLVLALPG